MIAVIQELVSAEYIYLAIFFMAATIVFVSTPTIIWTAIKHQLFDQSELYRKVHKRNISRLGGISIFCSFTITVLLFSAIFNYQQPIIIIVSSIILFATGLKDDIYGVGSFTKLALSLIVATMVVFLGEFRLTSLYGVLFVDEMSYIAGGIFSIVLIIFLNNAFNLIDGLDGLAGSIGIVINLCFGLFFAFTGNVSSAMVAFALVGSLFAFLYYNFSPSKIFMGDSGSLVVGMISAIFSIHFIEINKTETQSVLKISSAAAVAVAILIIPVFDSLLIFFMRIINRKSPFRGDRNHVHHRLKELGMKDAEIVFLLVGINVFVIFATYMMQHLSNFTLIVMLLSFCFLLHSILVLISNKKLGKSFKFSQLTLSDRF